jgi:hypothetical protein
VEWAIFVTTTSKGRNQLDAVIAFILHPYTSMFVAGFLLSTGLDDLKDSKYGWAAFYLALAAYNLVEVFKK